jgi:hypothetical protein
MADEDTTWKETVEQANSQNLKRFVDEWAEVSHNKASQQAGLQDSVNSLFLKWAMDAQGITNRAANDGANVSATLNSAMALASARGNDAAGAMQNLILAAALGQQVSINKMAAETASADIVAKKAVDAATAAMTGTSAPAQGTSGFAQGSIQGTGGVATSAIMAQITKLGEVNTAVLASLAVLAEKVAALEVATKPAA